MNLFNGRLTRPFEIDHAQLALDHWRHGICGLSVSSNGIKRIDPRDLIATAPRIKPARESDFYDLQGDWKMDWNER